MNTTYLLILLIVVLLTVAAFWTTSFPSTSDRWTLWGLIGVCVAFIMLVFSAAAPIGKTTVSTSPPDRIEQTPYRVVTTAFGTEQTWTDAFAVANAARINCVRRTVKHNAWGVQMDRPDGPTYELVFKP